jgi:hypothetical protein
VHLFVTNISRSLFCENQAKARLQAVGTTFKGPLDVLSKAMQQTGGLRSLYRGFGTVLIGGTPGTMLYLCSYDYIKEEMGGNDASSSSSFMVHFAGGMLAEAIACIIYVPVDVLKERMQVQNTYRNSWHGLTEIWKHEGPTGMYRGYGATLASFGPFSALYFLFYEQLKVAATPQQSQTSIRNENSVDLPFTSIILCSCSAGALASWLTSPLDMAKLRLQVARGSQASSIAQSASNTSMVQILRSVVQEEGVRGLFRGAGARVLHFAPATTITMTCYETFRSFFAKHI